MFPTMKKLTPTHLIAACGLLGLMALVPLGAQSTASNDELMPLVQSIAAQQKVIDQNQASIDKSLATIQENLRQAKIYISRAGGSTTK